MKGKYEALSRANKVCNMVGEGKQVSFDDLYNTSSLAVLQNEAEKRESFQKRFEFQTAGVIHSKQVW